MGHRKSQYILSVFLLLVFSLFSPNRFLAQIPSGTIRGQVSDPSGAGVPGAVVQAVSSSGQTISGVVKTDGSYEIRGLAPGKYTLRAEATGFAIFEQQSVEIPAGQGKKLDIALQLAEEKEQVTVSAQTTQVNVAPQENATSLVIKGEDLQALSDDPDELQSELDALAGPSAGPNGGQIYVDGFTAGQLPPKADILEIRINHNPFSAEYDKLGYGRIEITTRPGASQLHGQILGNLNDSVFNSRNPFATQEPGYHSEFFNGSVGDALSRKASFFFTFFRRDIQDNSIVSAFTLSPALVQTPFSLAVASPATRTNLSPRFDYQLSQNNVLTVRYQFFDNNNRNGGIGQLNLPTQGYNTHSLEYTLQVSDTQVFSAKTLNQLRFQYLHDGASQTAQFLEAHDFLFWCTSRRRRQSQRHLFRYPRPLRASKSDVPVSWQAHSGGWRAPADGQDSDISDGNFTLHFYVPWGSLSKKLTSQRRGPSNSAQRLAEPRARRTGRASF